MNVPFDLPDNVGIEAPAGPAALEAGALEGFAAMDPMGVAGPGWLNGIQLTTLPVRQRILSLMTDQRAKHQAKQDDAGIQNALALMERENARLQDLQQRHQSAMGRLAEVAPTPKATEPTTGELAASLLSGLVTGRQEDANKMLLARAAERGQRDLMADTAQFQANQRAAGMDADFLQGQMARSQGMLDRLETYRLGREADLIDQAAENRRADERFTEELAFRREERAARSKEEALNDARRTVDQIRQNLRMTGNPGLARTWIGEHNELAAQFGGRPISPDEEAEILKGVQVKHKQEGVDQVSAIVENYRKEAATNGGMSTPEMRYRYGQMLKIAGEEYGIDVPELREIDDYYLSGQNTIDDNNRADRRLALDEKRVEASVKDTLSKIGARDTELEIKLRKFLLESGESPSIKRIQEKVQDLRANQAGLKEEFDQMQAELQGLEAYSEQERIEKGYQDRYISLRSQLREARGKLTKIEGEIKGYAEVQKNLPQAPSPLAGDIGGMRLPGVVDDGTLRPMQLGAPGVSTTPTQKPKPAPKGKAPAKPKSSSLSDTGKKYGL